MRTIGDFEDMLAIPHEHGARYLIVGGLAFIYHAKPRYTKDMNLWVEPSPANLRAVNRASAEFGSPALLDTSDVEEILQLGVPPSRIDLLKRLREASFERA